MSRQINQPINQVKLTNVAVVRLHKNGKRFEIACYKNKVVNYRQGLETDLSEVLQTERVFTNVSKGQFANSKDLSAAFGPTSTEEDIAKLILQKGVMQVSDKEREQQLENVQREVATWVAQNCVHPASQRPYTVSQIRNAMRQAEFAVHPNKSVKRQYLECVKLLQAKQVLLIERAKMELSLYYLKNYENRVEEALMELRITATGSSSNESDEECSRVLLVDPSLYRPLDELAKEVSGRLEILRQVVQQEGDVDLEQELERRKLGTASGRTSNGGVSTVTADEEESLLVTRLQNTTLRDDDRDSGSLPNDIEDHESLDLSAPSTRKAQKKAQKKSKKAKRREKEEEVERQARITAERQRQEERAESLGISSAATTVETSNGGGDKPKSCNTCGGSFGSAAEYRTHFRGDWHRYNIKLKMKGVTPVSEEEFRLCDSDAFFEDM